MYGAQPPSTQVVNGRWDARVDESLDDNRLDLIPTTACEPTADARHVGAGSLCSAELCDALQASADGYIADGRAGRTLSDAVLTNQIGDPERVLNGYELNLPKVKWNFSTFGVPTAVRLLRAWPTPRNCQNESSSPSSDVVANMNDDFFAIAGGIRSIADEIRKL